jgi:Rod binding domain-containing protein
MTTALKNQPDYAFAKGMAHRPAQDKPTLRAESARTDVIAAARLTPHGELQAQAQNLIGTTFFATMLKQMHDSPFKSDLFSGGRGGQAFSGLYDQHLAQRMASRSAAKLTRPIVKKYKLAADAAYERQKRASVENAAKEREYVPHDRRA